MSPTSTEIADCIWRSEYRRATGKERTLPFSEISSQDQARYLFVADDILRLFAQTSRK